MPDKRKLEQQNDLPALKERDVAQHGFWDFWGPVLFTLSLYIGIRYFLAEARYIPSGSMLPSLQINDRLIIEKLTFRFRPPRRGEVVVFNSPYSFDPSLSPYYSSSFLRCSIANLPLLSLIEGLGGKACNAYIKRVIGIPGDNISLSAGGNVFLNGKLIDEPYVTNYCAKTQSSLGRCPSLDLKVPKKHVLVLGDNRSNSWDSRFWPGSPFLPEKEIIGRAVWRFWPLARVGGLNPEP